ncbi:hypothetical protein [Chryseobacterium sp. LAM-KRS1]|nr:hypothetical protein [Chryseobacterium sp. LAM-KRS1]
MNRLGKLKEHKSILICSDGKNAKVFRVESISVPRGYGYKSERK